MALPRSTALHAHRVIIAVSISAYMFVARATGAQIDLAGVSDTAVCAVRPVNHPVAFTVGAPRGTDVFPTVPHKASDRLKTFYTDVDAWSGAITAVAKGKWNIRINFNKVKKK